MAEWQPDSTTEVRDERGVVYRIPNRLLHQFAVLSDEERAHRHQAAMHHLETMLARHSPDERAAAQRAVAAFLDRHDKRDAGTDPEQA